MAAVRNVPLTIAACIALVAVSGCSDDGGDTAGSPATTVAVTDEASEATTAASTTARAGTAATTEAATTPVSTTAPEAVIDIDNQPGEGEFEGAVDDVTVDCTGADGVWTASGTVTNSTDAAVGYRIFISFLDEAGETVALVESDDDLAGLAPAEEREWAVSFESTATMLVCVPRVERRAA